MTPICVFRRQRVNDHDYDDDNNNNNNSVIEIVSVCLSLINSKDESPS